MLNGYIPGLRYNIKGSVATSRAMPTPFYLFLMKPVSFGPFGFMYIYSLIIISSCTPENIISKYTACKTSESHACRHIGGRAFILERLSYTKLISIGVHVICPFSEVNLHYK